MKSALVFAAVAIATTLSTGAALADPTDADGPGVLHLSVQKVYGRPNRPMILIDIRTPTAASAAGAAHETVRASLLDRAEPPAMRSP